MANKFVAFVVALSAAFVSYNLYNPPKSALVTMSGSEMAAFESPEVLKYVERMQYVSIGITPLLLGILPVNRAAATPERPALASERGRWAMAW